MNTNISRARWQAALTAALMAAGCGSGTNLSEGPVCTVPPLVVPFFSGTDASVGDAGALDFDASVPRETCLVHCPANAPNVNNFSSIIESCRPVTVDAGARMECRYQLLCTGGRAGDVVAPAPVDDSAGALLAAMATMEAGSVGAFDRLARELRAHHAPGPLHAAARRAKQEERRHARMMSSLAQRYGARPATAPRLRQRVRDLEAVARENAVEGCVREAWGALVASWQAQRAGDPRVRAAMAVIAREEASHAALAWRVAEWSEGKLTPAARERVAEARRAAVEALCAEAAEATVDESVARSLGWPRAAESRAMLASLRATVWNA